MVKSLYLDISFTGHLNIMEMNAPDAREKRSEKFVSALKDSPDKLRGVSEAPEDVVPNPPNED